MNHAEWLDGVGRKQLGLWPNQPWEPATMAAAFPLFEKLPLEPVITALEELAADGREFAPAPGVVLARALQLVINSTPRLQEPDLTRPLTDAEAARAKRIGAAIAGEKANLVVATWLLFAAHSKLTLNVGETAEQAAERIKACDGRCAVVANRCRRSGLQSHAFPPMWDELCEIGKPLFEGWRSAVDNLRMTVDNEVQQEASLV